MEAFNALPAERLEAELLAVCAAPAWGAAVAADRPYPSKEALLATAGRIGSELSWPEVLLGLSAHPRIGERAGGDSKEAAWSRREQSTAATTADESTRAELIAANRAYEERFGHVFLIFASGRSQEEILAAARERLGNDEQAERVIVTDQLRRIALLRLERLVDGHALSTHILDTVSGDPAAGVPVRLERQTGEGWHPVGEGRTDGDGRFRFGVPGWEWLAGGYRLVFAVEEYLGEDAFFPEVTVAFRVDDTARHYHVPLLLSRYGYTTYRGS
ncbi:hypothetical protein GCM10010435_02910 [Winogradskya consettensis]|uniref:Hydroxyisourate hydrolase n=1 Tax=Winogradskya consettensis TaxID=113560 RepID=A0A919S6U5_9ACTN|nr:2-oxo-4-hydroxy-4-carboxy-5-ureidoimidazoline decarboxylase [Actinoplanes consettensis]GIM66013.1 hypothetical protein Aco04nite_00040 [Actinoplanes consettensis]